MIHPTTEAEIRQTAEDQRGEFRQMISTDLTQPTEMEIRVARAIAGYFMGGEDFVTASHMRLARVAIRAMREPTQDMVDAGDRKMCEWTNQGCAVDITWPAMIDAASPQPGNPICGAP